MAFRKLVLFTFPILSAGALAFAAPEAPGRINVKSSIVSELEKIPSSTIKFEAGSRSLTESEKNSLRNLIKEAQTKGVIRQVTIVAWSDKMLPRTGNELSRRDRNLAKGRASAIENFLKSELALENVDTYNMAEPANWLARTLNSKDAELKSVFGRPFNETPLNSAQFYLVKSDGGPSKAVALVEYQTKHIAPSTPSDTPTDPIPTAQ